MATIIPISTNTTIAICIQIQVGDMSSSRLRASGGAEHPQGRLAGRASLNCVMSAAC
jgi:hypothetical protein